MTKKTAIETTSTSSVQVPALDLNDVAAQVMGQGGIAEDLAILLENLTLASNVVEISDEDQAEIFTQPLKIDNKHAGICGQGGSATRTLYQYQYIYNEPQLRADTVAAGYKMFATELRGALITPYVTDTAWYHDVYRDAVSTVATETTIVTKTSKYSISKQMLQDAIYAGVQAWYDREADKEEINTHYKKIMDVVATLAQGLGKYGNKLACGELLNEAEKKELERVYLPAGAWLFRELPRVAGLPKGYRFKLKEFKQLAVLTLGEGIAADSRKALQAANKAYKEGKSGVNKAIEAMAKASPVVTTTSSKTLRGVQIMLSQLITRGTSELASETTIAKTVEIADTEESALAATIAEVAKARADQALEDAAEEKKAAARIARAVRNSRPAI